MKTLLILLFPIILQAQNYKDFKTEFLNMEYQNIETINVKQPNKNIWIVGVVTFTGIGSYILNATNTTNNKGTALFFVSGMATAAIINIKF